MLMSKLYLERSQKNICRVVRNKSNKENVDQVERRGVIWKLAQILQLQQYGYEANDIQRKKYLPVLYSVH